MEPEATREPGAERGDEELGRWRSRAIGGDPRGRPGKVGDFGGESLRAVLELANVVPVQPRAERVPRGPDARKCVGEHAEGVVTYRRSFACLSGGRFSSTSTFWTT